MSHPPSSEWDRKRTVAEIAELAGGLAHELRNPLSTMMVNLKLLAEDLADAKAPAEDVRRRALLKVDVLRREAERLQSLFDDFLNVTGPCRLQRSPTNVNDIIRRLCEFFEPMAKSHGIGLECDLTEEPLICELDEKLFSQALLNLVINAQEAMPDGGTITLSTARTDDGVQVSVGDTGVGIAPEVQQRVFRPFFSTKATGTGLGLSFVQRIVDEHGGRIHLHSEAGKGTRFTLWLPSGAAAKGMP